MKKYRFTEEEFIMRKKKQLVFLATAALLFGCSKNPSSISSSGENSSTQSSQTSSTSSSPISSKEDSTSSTSTFDPYSVGWSKSVTDKMLKYLNSTVLPFISLGKTSQVDCEWKTYGNDYGLLEISGVKEWDEEKTPALLTSAFSEEDGWTITNNTTDSFQANKGKVYVVIGPKSTQEEKVDLTLTIQAYYEEDYDPSSIKDYDEETKNIFNEYFDSLPPVLYLSEKYPIATFDKKQKSITLYGGKFDSRVLEDNKTILEQNGYTAKIDSNTLSASGKVSSTSEDFFSITISQSDDETKKTIMEVKLIEKYDATRITSWPTRISQEFTNYLDGHTIPYLYLGTRLVTAQYTSSLFELDIQGANNITEDKLNDILSSSKQVFQNDGWEIIKDESADLYCKKISYRKNYSDNHILKCNVMEDSTYGIIIECYFSEALIVPEGSTSWSENTKSLMQENFSMVLPYVYLNCEEEVAVYDNSQSKMTITGGDYLSSIGDYIQTIYSQEKNSSDENAWDIDVDVSSGSLTMTGNYDGDIYKATLKNKNGKAVLTITFVPKYVTPDADATWDEDVINAFDDHMDSHLIPYIFLRMKKPNIDYSPLNKTLRLTGNEYDEEMMNDFLTKYTAENGWTLIEKKEATTRTASFIHVRKTFSDDCVMDVTFGTVSTYSKKAQLLVTLTEAYDINDASTSWDSETQTEIDNITGVSLPYIYLGSKKPYSYHLSGEEGDNYLDRLFIQGSGWNDEIILKASTAFSNDGYTILEGQGEEAKSLIAYKKLSTGNHFLFAFLEKSEGHPCLTFYRCTLENILNTGSYDSSLLSQVNGYIGDENFTMPYLNLGSSMSFHESSNYAYLAGNGLFSFERACVLMTKLKNDGYNLSFSLEDDSLLVKGEKELSNKANIKLVLENDSSATCSIFYHPPFNEESTLTSWGNEIETKMQTKFSHTIPYFYIGTETPKVQKESSNALSIIGQTWDDKIFLNAINAFEKEKDASNNSLWSYEYSSTDDTKALIAKRTYEDNTTLQVKIYHYVYLEIDYPIVEIKSL